MTTMQQPLEALLRPPVEWLTTITACLMAGIYLIYPHFLLLNQMQSKLFALSFIVLGGYRFQQGYRVYRYQKNLKQMPSYTMTSEQLPVSKRSIFLGKGFLWTPQHTQRLRDLDLPYNLHFKSLSRLNQWSRQKELAWENHQWLHKLVPFLRKDHWLNPFRPLPLIGGEPCLHGVSEEENDVFISLADRAGHMAVIGTTGVGKTRFAEILIGQDIRRGDVVIVLDPKGDADLLKRMYIEAKMVGREKDLLVFHLGFPQLSARYNPIGYFTKITQVATRVTNALPTSGNAASFKDFAWKYVNLVAKALVAMGVKPTYKIISFYITRLDYLYIKYCEYYFPIHDNNYENWLDIFIQENTKETKNGIIQPKRIKAVHAYTRDYLERKYNKNIEFIKNDIVADLFSANSLDKTYYDKITSSIGPLLEKLNSGEVGDLLSPNYDDIDDDRPIFDWLQVIRHKKIVYIGMDAMTDTVVSSAVGNAILSDMVSVSGHIYKYQLNHGYSTLTNDSSFPQVRIHADEFNEIIGDEFIPILNKARGSGFNVTVYTQTWSDVIARLESESKAGQVAGNLNNIVMFRTKESKTVNMLLEQLPTVPVLRVIPASSSADTAHGEDGVYYRSTNEDRFAHSDQRLIEQNDVLNLPKGQAFCVTEGGKLYKLRMPLPKTTAVDLPPSLQQLADNMKMQSEKRGNEYDN